MSKDSDLKNPSRRSFIKGVGAGVVGGTVLHALDAAPLAGGDESASDQPGKVPLELSVNGHKVRVMVEPRTTLVEVLRDRLELTGTKLVCNRGECGGCTVLLDDQPVYSCHILALDAAGRKVTTVEGLMTGEKLHPIQEAFIEHDGLQCGFCTPGQVMAAQGLLLKYPRPTREQVLVGMSGNLCRCGAYPNILASVLAAAEKSGK